MSVLFSDGPCRVYKFDCGDGRRFVIYNASEIGNPDDHVPDKWYFRPYPMPLGPPACESFDTADAAENAARAQILGARRDSGTG